MKKRGMRSPDLADAFLLTFACREGRKKVERYAGQCAITRRGRSDRYRRSHRPFHYFFVGADREAVVGTSFTSTRVVLTMSLLEPVLPKI
jgi:hypothetical protein